jgi:limonene 1,2-monooxygenase
MKFGVFTMPEHYPWDNWALSYQRDIDQMVLAEKLGFDEYWIGEHHTGGYENVPAPDLMIAKASALTHRIKLGTGVVNLPYHDPFLVAERMALLDNLCHGRLLYGFGAGGLPSDWSLFNMEGDVMRPRMREAIDIISQLNSAREPISYEGQFWQGENRRLQVLPYKGRIPEYTIAGLTGTSSFGLAGERGMGSLSVMFTPPKFQNNPSFSDLTMHAAAMEEASQAAGHPANAARRNWRVVREVYIADDRETAIKEMRKAFNDSYGYLLDLGMGPLMKLDEAMDDSEISLEWCIENGPWVVGSPDDAIQIIKGLYEKTGGFGTFVMNGRDWASSDRVNRSMELFARYVIPALEHLEPGQPEGVSTVERQTSFAPVNEPEEVEVAAVV